MACTLGTHYNLFLGLLSPCGKFRSSFLGKAQQLQEQRYPFLSVCAVSSCVQTMVWLPVFGSFDLYTDEDACHCTWGLHRHSKRDSRRKKTLPCIGFKPASVLRLAFQSDTLPTELSCPISFSQSQHWFCLLPCPHSLSPPPPPPPAPPAP